MDSNGIQVKYWGKTWGQGTLRFSG